MYGGTAALARRGIAIWEQVPSARVVTHDVAILSAPSRRLPRPLGRRCGLGRRPKHHAAAHPRSAAKQRCGHARATRLRQVGLGGRAGSLSGVGEAHILTLPGDLGAFAARARRAGRGRGGASRLPFGFHMCTQTYMQIRRDQRLPVLHVPTRPPRGSVFSAFFFACEKASFTPCRT